MRGEGGFSRVRGTSTRSTIGSSRKFLLAMAPAGIFFPSSVRDELSSLSQIGTEDGIESSAQRFPRLLAADFHGDWPVAVRGGKDSQEIEQVAADVVSAMDNTRDRKSTRLNSSHTVISYAVF